MFDWLFVLSAVLLLAGPITAVFALVRSAGFNGRLRGLESKLAALERQLATVDFRPRKQRRGLQQLRREPCPTKLRLRRRWRRPPRLRRRLALHLHRL
jgi:hypothetical protein